MNEPMRMFKRGKFWHAEFSGGKRLSLRTGDREEADSIFREMKKEYLCGRLLSLENVKRITLSDFRNAYTENRIGVSKWTLRKDALSLKLLADVTGGNIQLRAVTAHKIEDFKRVCKARGAVDISINGYLRHIKAALSWAIEEGYIEKKPRIKMFRVFNETPRVLEPDQIRMVLKKAFKTDRDMGRRLFFHLWTGTRRTEGCRLTWPDVDFRKMEIRVRGKGGKARLVPMLTPVAKMFLPIKKDIGRVFDDLHPDTVSHAFHKIAKACGVKARLHDLRHTCATYLLKSGVPLEVVQKILGHTHISTTQIYAQVLDEIKKREMTKLRFE